MRNPDSCGAEMRAQELSTRKQPDRRRDSGGERTRSADFHVAKAGTIPTSRLGGRDGVVGLRATAKVHSVAAMRDSVRTCINCFVHACDPHSDRFTKNEFWCFACLQKLTLDDAGVPYAERLDAAGEPTPLCPERLDRVAPPGPSRTSTNFSVVPRFTAPHRTTTVPRMLGCSEQT